MKVVGFLKYERYSTIVKVSEEVERFLNEKEMDLNIAARMQSPERWYEEIVFKKESNKEIRNFELVYYSLSDLRDVSVEEFCADFGVENEEVLMNGVVRLGDDSEFRIKWFLLRA